MTGSSFLILQIVNPPYALLFISPDQTFVIVEKKIADVAAVYFIVVTIVVEKNIL